MAWKNRNSYYQSNSREAKAKRTCDNIEFDSLAEMVRYRDVLKVLLQFKQITDFELQPRFYLDVFDYRLGFYTADFMYKDSTGTIIVEEIKGNKENREFSIKWKLVQLLNPTIRFIFLRANQSGNNFSFSQVKRVAAPIKNPSDRRGKKLGSATNP